MAAVPSTGGFVGYAGSSRSGSSIAGPSGSSSSIYNNHSNVHQHHGGGRRVTSQSSIASSTGTSRSSHHTSGGGPRGSLLPAPSSSSAAHIESTVTKLLVATKQLLEGLTDWSQGRISEEQVSDIYVRLGNCFNGAVSAFTKEGINMKDLKEIPGQLRLRLEAAINEDASAATLNEHLPKIRPIILDLLRGLREKQDQHQAMIAAAAERERLSQLSASPPEQQHHEYLPHQTEDPYQRYSGQQPYAHPSRQDSLSAASGSTRSRQQSSAGLPSSSTSTFARDDSSSTIGSANPRGSSFAVPNVPRSSSRASSHRQLLSEDEFSEGSTSASRRDSPGRGSLNAAAGRRPSNTPRPPSLVKSRSSSSLRPSQRQNSVDNDGPGPPRPESPLPPLPTPPANGANVRPPLPMPGDQPPLVRPVTPPLPRITTIDATPVREREAPSTPPTASTSRAPLSTPPRSHLRPTVNPFDTYALPTPPHVTDDAGLEALKKADPLSRRASKRFSQYTFNKMTGSQSMSAVSTPSSSLQQSLPSKTYASDRDNSARDFLQSSGSTSAMGGAGLGRDRSDSGQSSGSASSSLRKPRRSKQSPGSPSPYDASEPVPAIPSGPDGLPKLSFSSDGSFIGNGQQRSDMGRKRVSMVAEETEDQLAAEQMVRTPTIPIPTVAEEESDSEATRTLQPPAASTARKGSVSSVASSASNYSTSAVQTAPAEAPPEVSTPRPEHTAEEVTMRTAPRTIFLQLGRDMKKAVLEDSEQLSMVNLKMLFTEKFAYNPGLTDFPAIYLRDPVSGVQYELEDLDEIRDRSVLSLNIEPLDQVKQHIDEGLANLAREIKEIKSAMNTTKRASVMVASSQDLATSGASPSLAASTSPERKAPTEYQIHTAAQQVLEMRKKLPASGITTSTSEPQMKDAEGRGSVLSPALSAGSATSEARVLRLAGDLRTSFDEVQSIRREVATLRQVYVDFKTQTASVFGTLRAQAEQVKALAATKVTGSRAFIDTGKAKLDSKSQDLLTKIEELQDVIDDLKNDVTTRRIKPRPKQMESIKTAIAARQTELDDLTTYIQTVKPMWKKTWEAELQNIVEEQQLLNHQEELLADLKADHENVVTIFDQIQQYVSLRMAAGGRKSDFRPPSPGVGHEGLKTVMLEVKGLAPASDKRMKAIELAEKQRQKEAESKTDEFASELNGFVEAKMLKKTGGAEEVDRVRQLRSEASLKAMFTSPPAASRPVLPATSSDADSHVREDTPVASSASDLPAVNVADRSESQQSAADDTPTASDAAELSNPQAAQPSSASPPEPPGTTISGV